MRKHTLVITLALFCLFGFGTFFCAPAPASAVPTHSSTMSQPADTGPAARVIGGTLTQGTYAILDVPGLFIRGMKDTISRSDRFVFLKNPVTMIPLALLDGTRYLTAYPEQFAARGRAVADDNYSLNAWETSSWATYSANNPIIVGAKTALAGGVIGVVNGSITGLGLAETHLLSTSTGLIGGALITYGSTK